jgi:hypothetical protein
MNREKADIHAFFDIFRNLIVQPVLFLFVQIRANRSVDLRRIDGDGKL